MTNPDPAAFLSDVISIASNSGVAGAHLTQMVTAIVDGQPRIGHLGLHRVEGRSADIEAEASRLLSQARSFTIQDIASAALARAGFDMGEIDLTRPQAAEISAPQAEDGATLRVSWAPGNHGTGMLSFNLLAPHPIG